MQVLLVFVQKDVSCAKVFPTFSPISFNVPDYIPRYLIHLDLSFVQGDKYGSICILLHADILLDQHYLLKMVSFLLYQNSGVHKCVDLCLGLQFDSIDQPVCFYVNTTWFLLLYLCSTT